MQNMYPAVAVMQNKSRTFAEPQFQLVPFPFFRFVLMGEKM